MANASLKILHPFLKENDTKTSSGTTVKSYSHDNGDDVILCMVHGYPQTSYMWRHVVPELRSHASLFVPELPGYGISSSPPSPDKKAIGAIIIEALQSTFKNGSARPIIWCSHDRGARAGHRLLANPDPKHNLIAGVFMDIVPTLEQWRSFANPAASNAYWHWPFLAQPNAPEYIKAIGGFKFCNMWFNRFVSAGGESVNKKLLADNAIEHYCAQFDRDETIEGSCDDYADGSVPECKAQETEQEAGKKVELPLMVMYSEGSLAKMHDVPAVWKGWVKGELECVGVGEGHGHYFPESWPEIVVENVLRWVKKVQK